MVVRGNMPSATLASQVLGNYPSVSITQGMHVLSMLWFKFILGLMFFELASILFAIFPDYGNEYMTKENKNGTSFKKSGTKTKFKPKHLQ